METLLAEENGGLVCGVHKRLYMCDPWKNFCFCGTCTTIHRRNVRREGLLNDTSKFFIKMATSSNTPTTSKSSLEEQLNKLSSANVTPTIKLSKLEKGKVYLVLHFKRVEINPRTGKVVFYDTFTYSIRSGRWRHLSSV